jgi:hypothetical protein
MSYLSKILSTIIVISSVPLIRLKENDPKGLQPTNNPINCFKILNNNNIQKENNLIYPCKKDNINNTNSSIDDISSNSLRGFLFNNGPLEIFRLSVSSIALGAIGHFILEHVFNQDNRGFTPNSAISFTTSLALVTSAAALELPKTKSI